jgi:hypothetical protein
MDLHERKSKILELASELLSRNFEEISEQQLDCEFIFRFEQGWVTWVKKIRKMLHALLNVEIEDDLLPSEEAVKLWVHLEINPGVRTEISIQQGEEHSLSFDVGNYRPLGDELVFGSKEELLNFLQGDVRTFRELEVKKFFEASQTSKIQGEIDRLARIYQIIPAMESDWTQFSIDELTLISKNLRNYLLLGHPLPSFIWPKVTYIDTKINIGVTRNLRPHKSPYKIANKKRGYQRIRPSTRIRTWSIYFLTRRGGGFETEQNAVNNWNKAFTENLEAQNYRKDRTRLFKLGSKKA